MLRTNSSFKVLIMYSKVFHCSNDWFLHEQFIACKYSNIQSDFPTICPNAPC